MISEHANQVVSQVHGKTRKHPPHLGIQRRKRLQDKCRRDLLCQFGGA